MDFFGHKEAKLIAGIAVIMMMFHHFFGFPDYRTCSNDFIESFNIAGVSFERMLAAFGKLCVAIFAFSSGYVICKMQQNYKSVRMRFIRIEKFLLSYWVIFALFIIYGLIIGDPIPTGKDFIFNLIGLNTGPHYIYVNVTFAWYVTFYIILVITSPLLLIIFTGKSLFRDIILFIIITYTFSFIPSNIWGSVLGPFPVSILGILVAKWDVFGWVDARISMKPTWAMLGVIVLIALLRQSLILFDLNKLGNWVEGIFAAIFIFATINLFQNLKWKWIEKFFLFIGAYSMNLWFLHGIFFTGSRPLQTLLYYPKYPLLILIGGILMLIPIAIGCGYIQKYCNQLLEYCVLQKETKAE